MSRKSAMWLFFAILFIAILPQTRGQCCRNQGSNGFGRIPCGGCCGSNCHQQPQRPKPGPGGPVYINNNGDIVQQQPTSGPDGPDYIDYSETVQPQQGQGQSNVVQPSGNNVTPRLPPQPSQVIVDPPNTPFANAPPSPFAADEAQPQSLGAAAVKRQCQSLNCDFENNNLCAFSSPTWKSVTGRFQNPLTGVPKAAKNNGYAATYAQPREKNVLTSQVTELKSAATYSFQHFKATVGLELKFCCDSEANCPWKSDIDVSVREKGRWAFATVTCPEGTQRVIFVCENLGRNQGACAVDDLRCA